jgi:hypothetical protein
MFMVSKYVNENHESGNRDFARQETIEDRKSEEGWGCGETASLMQVVFQ